MCYKGYIMLKGLKYTSAIVIFLGIFLLVGLLLKLDCLVIQMAKSDQTTWTLLGLYLDFTQTLLRLYSDNSDFAQTARTLIRQSEQSECPSGVRSDEGGGSVKYCYIDTTRGCLEGP